MCQFFFSTSLSSLRKKGSTFFFLPGKTLPSDGERLDSTRKDPGWRIALCSEGWWSWCFLSTSEGTQLAQQKLSHTIFSGQVFFLKPSKWPKNIAGFSGRSCEISALKFTQRWVAGRNCGQWACFCDTIGILIGKNQEGKGSTTVDWGPISTKIILGIFFFPTPNTLVGQKKEELRNPKTVISENL